MDGTALQNLGAYTAQVVVLVAFAGGAAWILRLDVAGVRYAYWRAVFAACLLLPLLQGRQVPAPPAPAVRAPVETRVVVPEASQAPAATRPLAWTAVLVPVLVAGAGARLLWLGINLGRLRRLRRAGDCVRSELHAELGRVIGVASEIRYVAGLRQPVTFGLVRPVVLLPSELAARPEEIQRAVVAHELFHVKRRDWGWLLVEELTCALLWFNPAIWWVASRVQLAREVVVDELAVLATGRRRTYVEALLAFADRSSLGPVAAFGSRTQLFERIMLLSKEAGMSSRRLVIVCAVAVLTLGAAATYAISAFPLVAAQFQAIRQSTPGPLEQQAKPVTPENPVPRRTNFEPAAYPAEARQAEARGTVTLMLTLDELGRVVEARRVGLTLNAKSPQVSMTFRATRLEDESRLVLERSPQQSNEIRAIAAALEESAFRAVQQWRYEPPFAAPIAFPVTITIAEDQGEGAAVSPPASRRTTEAGAVRVGGGIKVPTKISDVRPVYPPAAQQARISGVVILEILVGPEGDVQDAKILRSIPLLDQAAIDAVMQWRFVPTLLNGQPVPVIMTVTVNFALQGAATQRGRLPDTLRSADPQPQVIKDVKPTYPAEARAAGVEGTVWVQATVARDGSVTSAHPVQGVPMLDAAAVEAVRQWRFAPIAQPRTVTIEITFTRREP